MFLKMLSIVLLLVATLPAFSQSTPTSPQEQKKEYTPEEKAKLKQAEEFAEKFVKRWHETLDLNVMFDELYSSDIWIRERNISKFCDCYDFIAAEAMGTCLQITLGLVGLETKRRGFMAFWNLLHLRWEYALAFSPSEDSDPPEPNENKVIAEEFEQFENKYYRKGDEAKRIARTNVKNFVRDYILLAEKGAAVYRKYLTADIFNSETYRANAKLVSAESEPPRIIIDGMPSEWRLEKGRPVYYVHRGLFELYLIEENGEFRVLTFGYEL